LTGTEAGLAGLWDFDDPANPGGDASPGAHHRTLRGNAQVVRAPPPSDEEMGLSLDGTNSYVELPPNIFNELNEATVEAWMKLDRIGSQDSTLFSFGSEEHDMFVSTHDDTARLKFVIYDAVGVRHGWGGPNQDFRDAPVAVDIVPTG